MKISRFEELKIWQDALKITKVIYDLSGKSKFNADFALKDQIRRSMISVSSNIVEGFEKNNNNEFIRFLKIAKGSAGETKNQLHIAFIVGYISKNEFQDIKIELESLSSQIGAFISYLEKARRENKFVKTRQPVNSSTR